MPNYQDLSVLQEHMPNVKLDPNREYLITTHVQANFKVYQGGWRTVGEVPDSTEDPSGTMVVLVKEEPNPRGYMKKLLFGDD